MRCLFLILLLFNIAACGSKSTDDLPDVVIKTGRIINKEFVAIEEVTSGGVKVNPSIFASIFSGGRISFGLGFLFTSDDDSYTTETVTRYRIKMLDGSEMEIFSDSTKFQIDDCVEVTIHKDVEKKPPKLKRLEGNC